MSIQVFENQEFRLQVTPDGDSFRIEAPGLAKALGFRDARDMVRSIPEPEKGSEIVRTPGGEQRTLYVTEPGFYRAVGQRQVARIKDPAVREQVARFQGWVYGEVLPSIRRTGSYEDTPPVPPVITLAITARLAEIAHRDLVVPASGRILAHHRWNNPRKGMEAFGEVCVQLELDFRPLAAVPALDAPAAQPEIGR